MSRSVARWARPVGLYVGAWLAVLLGAGVVALARPRVGVMQTLHMWDGSWYLAAAAGYGPHVPRHGPSDLAFFPLYPLAIRAVHLVLRLSYPVSAEAAAFVFGAAAVVAVDVLARDLLTERPGEAATALFAFFPAAFVLSLAYAEGLMIAASAVCLHALGRRRWLLAGVAAAAATATRSSAVVLVVCCGWAAGGAVARRHEWRALVAPALAPVGILAYFGFLWARTGDVVAWFHVEQRGWGEHEDWGASAVRWVGRFVTDPLRSPPTLIHGLTAVFAVVGLVLMIRRRFPTTVCIYGAGVLLFTVVSAAVTLRPRLAFTAFPLVLAIGGSLPRRAVTVAVGVAAAAMVALVVYYGLGPAVAEAP